MQHQTLTPQAAAESIGPDMFDASACRRWVTETTRGAEPACPGCGVTLSERDRRRLFDGKKIRCGSCGRWSSPRTGTVLEGSTLSDQQLFLILTLLHWELPAYHIAAMAGCDHATVYNWRNRLASRS